MGSRVWGRVRAVNFSDARPAPSRYEMAPPKKGFRDWVGLWYLLAREKGSTDVFSFGKIHVPSGQVEWHDFSHSQVDGAGAFAFLLRKEGYGIATLPKGKAVQTPSWRERLKLAAYLAQRLFKKQKIEWISAGDPERVPDRHDFPWTLFNGVETARLKTRAKERKISLNALILSCMNRVAAEALVKGNDSYVWLFPVNMRGGVNLAVDTANHSSAIALELNRRSGAQDVYNQIRFQLKSNSHWGIWWLLNMGKWVGVRGMRFILRKRNEQSHCMGTFSSMGEWPPADALKSNLSAHEVWMVAPPGTKNFPLSVGCLIWNGQLSVSLKVHPSVCADRRSAALLLQKFRVELERCCY